MQTLFLGRVDIDHRRQSCTDPSLGTGNANALSPVFLYLAPLLGVAVVLLMLTTEKPLPTAKDSARPEPTPLSMAEAALD